MVLEATSGLLCSAALDPLFILPLVSALGLSTHRVHLHGIPAPPTDPHLLVAVPSCALPVHNVMAVTADYIPQFPDTYVRENMHFLASFAFLPLFLYSLGNWTLSRIVTDV